MWEKREPSEACPCARVAHGSRRFAPKVSVTRRVRRALRSAHAETARIAKSCAKSAKNAKSHKCLENGSFFVIILACPECQNVPKLQFRLRAWAAYDCLLVRRYDLIAWRQRCRSIKRNPSLGQAPFACACNQCAGIELGGQPCAAFELAEQSQTSLCPYAGCYTSGPQRASVPARGGHHARATALDACNRFAVLRADCRRACSGRLS